MFLSREIKTFTFNSHFFARFPLFQKAQSKPLRKNNNRDNRISIFTFNGQSLKLC